MSDSSAVAVVTTKFDDAREAIEMPQNVLKIARSDLRFVGEKRLPFDWHLCNKIIGYMELPGDRILRPDHVRYLLNAAIRGTFHQEWVSLIVCKFDNDLWRMNGQHTCLMRLELPEKWPKQEMVRVMTYEADTLEAMRELYSSIDRGAVRTRNNVIASYLKGTEQFDGVPDRLMRLLGEGLSFWLWEQAHERKRHDADEVAYLMQHQHKILVDCVAGFCMQEPKINSISFLRRASVIAAMLETFSKVHQASVDFWTGVKTGVDLPSADDPRLRLRNTLAGTKMVAPDSARTKSIDRESMYRWCILAFNTWRRGDEIRTLRATKERQKAK